MKKFLSFMLAAAMAVGACVGFAGCDFGGNDDNSNNNGGSVVDDGNGNGNNNGNNNNNPPVGTDTKTELLGNIAKADISHFTLDADVDVSIKTDGSAYGGKATTSAAADLSDLTNPALDVLVSVDSETEAEDDRYDILFMRDGYAYSTEGAWEDFTGVKVGDFDALLNAYRSSDTLGFVRNSMNSGNDYEGSTGSVEPNEAAAVAEVAAPEGQEIPFLPLAIKLVGNLAEVAGCEVKSVSGGFSVDFDLVKSLNSVVDGVSTVLETASPATKVNDVVNNNAYISGVLSTLFKGISAKEVFDIVEIMNPEVYENMTQALPAPGDTSLFDYLKNALNNKELYAGIAAGLKESGATLPESATCFGDLTVKDFFVLAGGSEVSEEEITGMIGQIKEVVAALKKDLVGTIAGLIAGGAGTGSVDKVAVSLLFDSSKNFTGIDVAVSNLKSNVTVEYHDFINGVDYGGTHTAEVTSTGSASVKLVNSVTLKSLTGLKYESSEVDTTKLKPRQVYDSSETEIDLYTQPGREGAPEYADITYDVTWDITSDKISVSVVIPQLGLKGLSKEVTLSQIQSALTDENHTVEFPIVAEDTQVTYKGQTYYFSLSLEVYGGEDYLSVGLSHSNGYFAGETVHYQPILVAIA